MIWLLIACTGASSGVQQPGDDSAGSAVAEFSAITLSWEGLTPGFSETRALTVSNVGSGDLDVSEARVVTNPDGVFSTDFSAQTVAAGASVEIEVAAVLAEPGTASGELRVVTSDPAQESVLITLVAEG